jgi:hypothetical protein
MRARRTQPPKLDCTWRGALVQASLEENGGESPERVRGVGFFLRDVLLLIYHSDRVLQPHWIDRLCRIGITQPPTLDRNVLKDMNRSGEPRGFRDEGLLERALSTWIFLQPPKLVHNFVNCGNQSNRFMLGCLQRRA